jgi:hypothetical protein
MTINIPESLKEITLKQYQDFTKTNEGSDDEQFVIHRLISIFCGITMKEALNIKLTDAESIAEDIVDVLNLNGKLQTTFTHNGKTWGMIPNLNDISLGEYVDLEEGLKSVQTFNRAMAVLYRPVTRKFSNMYDIEPYEGASKYQEEAKTFPMDVVQSAVVFFWNLSNELVEHSPLFFQNLSKGTNQKRTTQLQDNSLKNGAGLEQYSSLVNLMLTDLKKQRNRS